MCDEGKPTKRTGNISRGQKQILIEFVESNPNLTRSNFSADYTCKNGQRLWQEITNILNASPGAKIDWKQWKRTWQDFQGKAKAKQSSINRNLNATGGGPLDTESLSVEEKRVLNIIHATQIKSDCNIDETPIRFDYSEEYLDIDITNEKVETPDAQPGPSIIVERPTIKIEKVRQKQPLCRATQQKQTSGKKSQASVLLFIY
ncbi:uncharacterized protein LOC128894816 [Hylaeus anthracinus]|uniref:uncharacterized protein LOC128894816 n=1 Tax=Hylaeus anthracinus TaxID=313031 RepID=UPI0023BA086A|nr:uncharacterized protein LOC128894816 [Hylaeus anthracinus]